MKFDPYDWVDVTLSTSTAHQAGPLRIVVSHAAQLYSVLPSNREVLIGQGARFEVDMAEAGNIKLYCATAGAKAVMYLARTSTFTYADEVFTNIDDMPVESGHMADITAAMRRFEYEKRLALAEMRAEVLAAQQAIGRQAPEILSGEVIELAEELPPEAPAPIEGESV